MITEELHKEIDERRREDEEWRQFTEKLHKKIDEERAEEKKFRKDVRSAVDFINKIKNAIEGAKNE